jgi:hypothetical protein
MIYYRLASNDARQLIQLLYELFCFPDVKSRPAAVRARQRIE